MTKTWPALFDRLADGYDQVIPFFAGFAAQLVEVVDPPVGSRLLDIGTGRGAIAAAAVARGCVVTAVDAAPRMVSLVSAAYPAVDARVMDVQRLEFPDDSYDLATGGFVIHLIAEPVRVLAELRRVVRPGGRVALTTPGSSSRDSDARWSGWHTLVGEFAARVADDDPPHSDLDVGPALTEAGFVDLRTVGIAVHLPVADPQTCWDFHMSHGFAAFVEALSASEAAEFRRLALAELARMHDSGGIVVDRGATVYLGTVP